MSCYNMDEADIGEQRKRFDLFEKEARMLLKKRLPVPAYDNLLKCSHAFNILDARGAVGVTERANCFATMRSITREVTGLWIARREELEHPLGLVPAHVLPPPGKLVSADLPTSASTFVLEIGVEELPPDDVVNALEQLRGRWSEQLTSTSTLVFEIKVEEHPPDDVINALEQLRSRLQEIPPDDVVFALEQLGAEEFPPEDVVSAFEQLR
eukprot:gene30664-35682_t